MQLLEAPEQIAYGEMHPTQLLLLVVEVVGLRPIPVRQPIPVRVKTVALVVVVALAVVAGEHQMELELPVKAQMAVTERQQTLVAEAAVVLR